ncbi:MAG: ATP-binding cassette domain-containing protein [Acidobacteria bacterium]|nr:ATP-binding cassette domain-containing protein [Acidobacteriota bacterium]
MIIGKHMKQMKLNTKLLLGFTVPLVLIVAIAAVVYTHVGSLIETSKRVTHTHQSIEFGTALTLDLINMETGLRGYLLTGKEDFLDPYKNGRKSFKESIFKAKKHVNDSPMQVKRLEKIEERYEEWIEQWVAPGIDQRKMVKKGVGGMGRIISRVQTAGSKSYMEGMRAALNEFIAAERVFIKSRNMQMEATANLTTNVTVFGAMAAVLLGAILTFFITRNILRQLGRDPALVVRIAERIASGEHVAIMGPSGCGKSTLLYVLGGLTPPSSGRVLVDGNDLGEMSDSERTLLRRRKIGFVFQRFNLLPTLTAYGNIAIAQHIQGDGFDPHRFELTVELLGLKERLHHRPSELSGGEQQRVAIARAVVTDPKLVLADEPTGNLDSQNSEAVLAMLKELNSELGQTLILITHNPEVAAHADRILHMRDGCTLDSAAHSAPPQHTHELIIPE